MSSESLFQQAPVRAYTACLALVISLAFAGPGPASADKRLPAPAPAGEITANLTEGSLISLDDQGRPTALCPLKHTDVKIEISGFLARVQVTQQFENPFPDKIEAVYTFPLPQRAAVDDMTLTVGDRIVKAKIKRREEAQAIYAAARKAGQVAGLLDQERPNIFTQSVANIMPGEQVTVTISYVELLKYEEGSYELVFPMVVGPRYIPGTPTGKLSGGWAFDTDQVPDASRITPPGTPPDTRAGHDISIAVNLDAGLPLEHLASPTHQISVDRPAKSRAAVRLRNEAVIPNKDFILTYQVAGKKIQDAVLTHRQGKDGFFTLILQPPDRVTPAEVTPKELVFVLDTSGSMSGFPIDKAKETMKLALENLYPSDTFNLITFAGDTHMLFPEPVPATKENLRKAQAFLASRSGGGGTEMMKAIRAALEPSDSQEHVRIVCFMTDGYVGNDMAIIGEVQKHPNARVFSFGIGSSVNRFLLDKMAEHGRGEVEYVGLKDDGSAAAKRFHERIRNPLLTDIEVDWGRLPITEVYPEQVPDLFGAKPVILTGRYTASAKGTVRLRGKAAGRNVSREIRVEFPATQPQHEVLGTLWARTKIDVLMAQDYQGIQQGSPKPEVRKAITQLGLDYRLMTQYTSFVAVEELTFTEGGEPRRIDVPVEMPEGVSYDGVFGFGGRMEGKAQLPAAGEPARLRGFSSSKVAPGIVADALERAEAPAQDKEAASLGKLHPNLAAVVERLQNKTTQPTPAEKDFVKHGKAELQVWLDDASAEILAELEALGLEIIVQPKTAKMVIGRLPLNKLADLAKHKAVRYVSPNLATS